MTEIKLECIKAIIDKENDCSVPIGSIYQLIEVNDDGYYLIEEIYGINEGIQNRMTATEIAKHFKVLPE